MYITDFLNIIKSLERKGLIKQAQKLDDLGRRITAQMSQPVQNQMHNLDTYYNNQMNNAAQSYGNTGPTTELVYKYMKPLGTYNGINHSGQAIELSQAEYNKLQETDKQNYKMNYQIDDSSTINKAEYDKLAPDKKEYFRPYITNIAQKAMTRQQYYTNYVPQSQQFNNYMGQLPYEREQMRGNNPEYFNKWTPDGNGGLNGNGLTYNPNNTNNFQNMASNPFVYNQQPNQQPNQNPMNQPNSNQYGNGQNYNNISQLAQYAFNAYKINPTIRGYIRNLGYHEQFNTNVNGFIYYDSSGRPTDKDTIYQALFGQFSK